MLSEASGETLLWTDVKNQFGCRLVEGAVSRRKRARGEGMDGESMNSEPHEADEEMLANAPGRSGGDANADEAIGDKAYAGFVADAVLEVDTNLTVQPG